MIREIQQILDEKKLNAERLAKENLARAFLIEGFKNAYGKEQEQIILRAKAKANNQTFNNSKLEQYSKQVDKILNQNNLTRQDLFPQYSCPKCLDTGIVNGKECDCLQAIRSELLIKNSFIKEFKAFKNCDFSLFSNNQIEEFYKKMQEWSKKDNRTKHFLTLRGATGVGKTFLMQCLASEFLAQKKYIIFKTAFELVNEFLQFHKSFDKIDFGILKKYFICDVLFIDDIGSEPFFNNVTVEYLYSILNQRTANNKITIISTNLPLEQIREIYGDRIYSRMIDKNIAITFNLVNEDIRLKLNKKKQ